ncbi:FISUMP domain-containing protein [uncultured Fibrobacter sp.]|uniref:FISUMP domain-containing protein n=1 Tax=uncultured Fibrobacter sp. TaxID=261512 RepID=UPI002592B1CA|nr:FISUMP domain-containing protein [uncultured Fibrobacter sp.]
MRILNFTSAGLVAILAVMTACGSDFEIDTFKDTRDGQEYKTIQLGGHIWMAENMRYNIGRNICRDDDPSCEKYGRYYYPNTVELVCPGGWTLTNKRQMEIDYVAYYTNPILKKLGLSPEEFFSKKGDEREKFIEKYAEEFAEIQNKIKERTKDKKLYNLMFQNVADGSFFRIDHGKPELLYYYESSDSSEITRYLMRGEGLGRMSYITFENGEIAEIEDDGGKKISLCPSAV